MKKKKNPMPAGRWDEIMQRDQGCQAQAFAFPSNLRCTGRSVIHHRIGRGAGGSADTAIHDAANLVVLCDGHHAEVHSHPALSYECGLMIRRNQ